MTAFRSKQKLALSGRGERGHPRALSPQTLMVRISDQRAHPRGVGGHYTKSIA